MLTLATGIVFRVSLGFCLIFPRLFPVILAFPMVWIEQWQEDATGLYGWADGGRKIGRAWEMLPTIIPDVHTGQKRQIRVTKQILNCD